MLARATPKSKRRPDVSLRRAVFVTAFIVVWMLAIGVRLVYLQVSMHDKLAERAHKQQQGAIETSPERGLVSDREGRQLARSIETDSIFLAPDEVADLDGTAEKLAGALGLDGVNLFRQLHQANNGDRRFVWVARRISLEQAEKVLALQLKGVHARKEPKRFYPNGTLAAHVLGFVGLDNAGHAGIEQFYNQKISGEAGRVFLEADSRGRAYESSEVPAKPGQNVVLTLDQMIQYRADQALAAAVKQAHAKSGTVVVLDPRTGEILALSNSPTFDPNNPGAAQAATRLNQALEYVYEPGSTFKIVAYSAAIEKGLVKPDDKIDCQMGSITVAGRLIHDHHPFGLLTVAEALAKSSNVGAIKLGLRVGDSSMFDFIKRYGFGARTGVELPNETGGIVRPLSRWQASSIGSIAMGQEVGVTPLQMAAAFAVVANGGVRVAPHIVREIRTATGATVYQPSPEQRRVISADTANVLKSMLEGVTLRGTATKAQLNGYTAAGKTGTAQKIDPKTHAYSKTKYVASFVGFAPVENPAVVIVVVIDEPAGSYHGGAVAAPVFRDIAEQILPDLGIGPDTQMRTTPALMATAAQTPEAIASLREERRHEAVTRSASLPQVTRRDRRDGEIVYAVATKKAMVMPDLRGGSVRDVARTCMQLGLQVEAHGDGRVWRQNPAAGAEVATGQIVYVDFGRVN
jgi:cell division protein FtsI (penicillin-binding protein 3)